VARLTPLSEMTMPAKRKDLLDLLDTLSIATRTVDHPAVFTVAESSELERTLPGGHTKNLFLKDDKGALFLVIAEASTRIDLKALSKRLGAGRFSFGKPELLMEALGVTPGSVTAFSVINDPTRRVRVVVDEALRRHETVNCHPLENTATTNIAFSDLLRFIRHCGNEPRITILGSDNAAAPPAGSR
jgi:Ala-tRNA(Pro) deacylase